MPRTGRAAGSHPAAPPAAALHTHTSPTRGSHDRRLVQEAFLVQHLPHRLVSVQVRRAEAHNVRLQAGAGGGGGERRWVGAADEGGGMPGRRRGRGPQPAARMGGGGHGSCSAAGCHPCGLTLGTPQSTMSSRAPPISDTTLLRSMPGICGVARAERGSGRQESGVPRAATRAAAATHGLRPRLASRAPHDPAPTHLDVAAGVVCNLKPGLVHLLDLRAHYSRGDGDTAWLGWALRRMRAAPMHGTLGTAPCAVPHSSSSSISRTCPALGVFQREHSSCDCAAVGALPPLGHSSHGLARLQHGAGAGCNGAGCQAADPPWRGSQTGVEGRNGRQQVEAAHLFIHAVVVREQHKHGRLIPGQVARCRRGWRHGCGAAAGRGRGALAQGRQGQEARRRRRRHPAIPTCAQAGRCQEHQGAQRSHCQPCFSFIGCGRGGTMGACQGTCFLLCHGHHHADGMHNPERAVAAREAPAAPTRRHPCGTAPHLCSAVAALSTLGLVGGSRSARKHGDKANARRSDQWGDWR